MTHSGQKRFQPLLKEITTLGIVLFGAAMFSASQTREITNFLATSRTVSVDRTRKAVQVKDGLIYYQKDKSLIHAYAVQDPLGNSADAIQWINIENATFSYIQPFTRLGFTLRRPPQVLMNDIQELLPCFGTRTNRAVFGKESRLFFNSPAFQVEEELGGSRRVSWRIPALHCLEAERIEVTADGAKNEYSITSIQYEASDPAHFGIDLTFTEASPKAMEEAYQKLYPGHELWGDRLLQILESRYAMYGP
jgi:hypothetical protein